MLETAATIYVYETYIGLFLMIGVVILFLLIRVNKKIFIYGILTLFAVIILSGLYQIVSQLS